MQRMNRRESIQVMVGDVPVGGKAPIVVQSMTNTDTADIEATIDQVDQLHLAGSELVRLTVNNEQAAQAVPHIKEGLLNRGVTVPLIGDFHYNGHVLLTKYPEMAQALSKYRINPGNTGTKTRDQNFATIVEQAIKHDKPVRIGVNWGSLDQQLLAEKMDQNNQLSAPKSAKEVMFQTMVESAVRSSKLAEEVGLASDKIIISCKMSGVQDVIEVYTRLAKEVPYPLHVGLTEAGMGMKGMVASSAFLQSHSRTKTSDWGTLTYWAKAPSKSEPIQRFSIDSNPSGLMQERTRTRFPRSSGSPPGPISATRPQQSVP